MINRNQSTAGMLGWSAVIMWFSANVLSQAAFIGTHGVPYDAATILDALGPWSWVLIVIELSVWIIIGAIIIHKIKSSRAMKKPSLS
ncbi:MAG: hypothetical protein QF831_05180 [Candidatus Thalassarchaeaceae archaeon]|jgi:uncharacterized membrane protein YwaF|nr:hypothetical protein [Candidatus Thalassarchaeaceae archaeon]MDP7659483.1 hypothetical protein [Candidatus Thalassarchaeaceae archaeon]